MGEHNCNFDGKKVLIVSGGTGGHIIPAIVFGRWLEARGATVTWLSGSRPLAKEIYASHGINTLLTLPIKGSPLGVKRPKEILKRSWHLFSSFKKSAQVLSSTGAEIIFLFGGYVSFAPLIIGRWRKIPVVMHEQNTIAGRVTKLASRMGATITTGWPECLGLKDRPFTHVGIPVREPNHMTREAALRAYGLNDLASDASVSDVKIIGVAGGSLGSKPLTEKLLAAAKNFHSVGINSINSINKGQRVEFVLLADALTDSTSHQDKADLSENIHFVGRQWDVNPLYSMCDVLVCRAGASTLAEALAWNIPTLVVPWEGSAGGHQYENARCFVNAIQSIGGDGVLCPENTTCANDLADAITRLLGHAHDHKHEHASASSANFDAACRALANAAVK